MCYFYLPNAYNVAVISLYFTSYYRTVITHILHMLCLILISIFFCFVSDAAYCVFLLKNST
jgi:hypothetical protein